MDYINLIIVLARSWSYFLLETKGLTKEKVLRNRKSKKILLEELQQEGDRNKPKD